MCAWCDAVATRASRERIATAALAERALLTAAHIAAIARLEPAADGAGVTWQPVDLGEVGAS